jgi:hypothetical protein
MFVYSQKSGELFYVDGFTDVQSVGQVPISDTGMYGFCFGKGYSGRNEHRNDPSSQSLSNQGPLPRGNYVIEKAERHPVLGPLAMPLLPDGENTMFGRGDFWIHGDNANHDASHGCIVLNHQTRANLSLEVEKGNKHLLVLA